MTMTATLADNLIKLFLVGVIMTVFFSSGNWICLGVCSGMLGGSATAVARYNMIRAELVAARLTGEDPLGVLTDDLSSILGNLLDH